MSLSVCVFASDKQEKYKKELLKIKETWGRKALECGIKVYYFVGEEQSDLLDTDIIHLKNVKDDYESASYKQYLGLKYIYETDQTDFVLCCGTDTYLNIQKLLQLVKKYNPHESIYLGGHGCVRQFGPYSIRYHSGGPGFILSREFMNHLYPLLDTAMDQWKTFCRTYNREDLITACDVGISYFSQLFTDVITINADGFYHCNYKGNPCHIDKFKYSEIYACHSMSTSDFDEFTLLLENNYYFTET